LARITIARSAKEMDVLRPLWEELQAAGNPTFFQSFEWNRLSAEWFADRLPPLVIAAETESAAAVVPGAVHHKSGTVTLLGEMLFDYRAPLWNDVTALQAALAELGRTGMPLAFSAAYDSLPDEAGLTVKAISGSPQVLRRDIDAETFAAAHPRLGRNLRRMSREGVDFHRHSGAEASLVERIYRHKGSEPHGTIFSDPQRVAFMVAACDMAGDECELFTLEQGPELVAALVTFLEGTTRRFYTNCFDPLWARHSPGLSLIYEATRQSLAAGLDCDYMTGEQPYKMRLATSVCPLYTASASADVLRALKPSAALQAA
jgi:CelD/BcsL family acetyltransferase involved in cellulose biosynthesis